MYFDASHIMTKDVISVKLDTTLAEVVKILAEKKISGLPVGDNENKLVGVLTETDIVEHANSLHVIPLIASSSWISPHTEITKIAIYKRGFELLSKTKVERVMSKKMLIAKASTSGFEIANLMKKRRINHIPVVDENGKLIGIVARSDIVNYLAEKHC